MKTALTAMFGIEHPIVSAGMARVSQAPLVAAVSAAGAMGCLGGVSFLADDLRAEIEAIRRATSAPFAVNLLVPPSFLDEIGELVVGGGGALGVLDRRGTSEAAGHRPDGDARSGAAAGRGDARGPAGRDRADLRRPALGSSTSATNATSR